MDARHKDRHLVVVEEWTGGCVYCGAAETTLLPGLDHFVDIPFCTLHVRWALASRRERVGKQARHLKKLVLAWVPTQRRASGTSPPKSKPPPRLAVYRWRLA